LGKKIEREESKRVWSGYMDITFFEKKIECKKVYSLLVLSLHGRDLLTAMRCSVVEFARPPPA
jgi:hypothetical protein